MEWDRILWVGVEEFGARCLVFFLRETGWSIVKNLTSSSLVQWHDTGKGLGFLFCLFVLFVFVVKKAMPVVGELRGGLNQDCWEPHVLICMYYTNSYYKLNCSCAFSKSQGLLLLAHCSAWFTSQAQNLARRR